MRKLLLCIIFYGIYQLQAQNIGIGTTLPSDKLHISAALGEDPLRVQVSGITKFRVHTNGGVGIGAGLAIPPDNGLLVAGIIRPLAGIETAGKLVVESTGDSIILNAGGSQVIIAANGNIIIKAPAGKITIEAVSDLDLKAANISLQATGTLNLQSTGAINLNAGAINQNGLIRFNGGGKKLSGIGDTVVGGVITSGSPSVFSN